MPSYSLFGPFILVKEIPDAEAESFRARRFTASGAITGAVRLTRYGPPESRRIKPLVKRANWGQRVGDPAVVRVLEVGVVEGELYAVSEIAEGPNLAELLEEATKQGKPPSVPVCVAIGAQLAALAHRLYEREAGELLVGYLRPEHVVIGWDGRVRARARGVIPRDRVKSARGNKGARDPFIAPELTKGGKPSLASEAWTVGRLLRAALAADATGRDTPKVSTAYRDSLGPLLQSSLARKPPERMLMPALEERLVTILQESGDDLHRVIADYVYDLYGDRGRDDDDQLLGAELMERGENIYAHAPMPELHYPGTEGFEGGAFDDVASSGAFGDDDEPSDPFADESISSAAFESDSGDVVKTELGLRGRNPGDLGSSLFGRILEEHGSEDASADEDTPKVQPKRRERKRKKKRARKGRAPHDAIAMADPSVEDPDLEAIALLSLDDSEAVIERRPADAQIDPTQTAASMPHDTAVSDVGALGLRSEEEQEGGTDVMHVPPQLRGDGEDVDLDSLLGEDDEDVFAGDGLPTRTDPVQPPARNRKAKAAKPPSSRGGSVSAIFTRSSHVDPGLRDAEDKTQVPKNSTRSMRRPSREDLWSNIATDPGRSPVKPSFGDDKDDVFAAGRRASPPKRPDPDSERTDYVEQPAAPGIDEDKTAYLDNPLAGEGSAGEGEDPNKTAYLDNPLGVARGSVLSETEVPEVDVDGEPLGEFEEYDEDEVTTRLSADVAKAIAAGMPSRAQALLDDLDEQGDGSLSLSDPAWAKSVPVPTARHEPAGGMQTSLLPVNDIEEVLKGTQVRGPVGQDQQQPASIAEVLPDDPEMGILVVDVPEGAVVFLNGEQVGTGRTVVHELDRFVSYVVRVHLRKHAPWTGNVTLRGMRAARVEPELVKR